MSDRAQPESTSQSETKIVPVREGDMFKGGRNSCPPSTQRPQSVPHGQGGSSAGSASPQ
jgi:hypothetical protein